MDIILDPVIGVENPHIWENDSVQVSLVKSHIAYE